MGRGVAASAETFAAVSSSCIDYMKICQPANLLNSLIPYSSPVWVKDTQNSEDFEHFSTDC